MIVPVLPFAEAGQTLPTFPAAKKYDKQPPLDVASAFVDELLPLLANRFQTSFDGSNVNAEFLSDFLMRVALHLKGCDFL